MQKVLVVKNTTRKNICDFVVYHKGLSFVGNATPGGDVRGVRRVWVLRRVGLHKNNARST